MRNGNVTLKIRGGDVSSEAREGYLEYQTMPKVK